MEDKYFISTIHTWRQCDLMKFIQRVERLHVEDKNFHILESLNLTIVRFLRLTRDKLQGWVSSRRIEEIQCDILENSRSELEDLLKSYVDKLMQAPSLAEYYEDVMNRLDMDIVFGVDVIEHYNSPEMFIPFLKTELEKKINPKLYSISSYESRSDDVETRSGHKDQKLLIFQIKNSAAGFCLRNHVCKYIANCSNSKMSESTISKHLSNELDEMKAARYPINHDERNFIKDCQEKSLGITHLSAGHMKITANSALEILRRHGINRVLCEVFMEPDDTYSERENA
ncbi:5288_t:CDS:2 [Entrophospora sp. SA101]|nr:118_t:CDS:2 [Entrophospora sp. SA101]CAJ0755289.1 23576_t:CDS:2 [Entrophospora sp. SA101]CAJ0756669.1 5288_t:CDS:2 [Entrophospora sp. SA101]CAJ0836892.1 18203_t:CDS:2 [Entrophospora sp. SA101]CAJ0841023.1 388_t:CDS:2 [Entrophospora sp. SA101]